MKLSKPERSHVRNVNVAHLTVRLIVNEFDDLRQPIACISTLLRFATSWPQHFILDLSLPITVKLTSRLALLTNSSSMVQSFLTDLPLTATITSPSLIFTPGTASGESLSSLQRFTAQYLIDAVALRLLVPREVSA